MRELYSLLYEAAHKAPSGLSTKYLADKLGISLNTLNIRLNPEYDNRHFPVEDLHHLCVLTRDYRPLNFICEQAGGVFIKLPEVQNKKIAVHIQCMDAVQRFGQLMDRCSNALADGIITREEADELSSAGYQAICGIMMLMQEANRTAR